MSSSFAQRLRLGLDRIDETAGLSVIYRRDGQELTLTAVPCSSAFEHASHEGLTTRRRVRDYKLNAADLEFDGELVEPRAGDEITETIGSETVTFEVCAPAANEPAWRYADHDRTRYRIHTREIEI